MKTVKLASAGAWHAHARDFANRVKSIPIPDCEMAAVYDSDPQKASDWATELGCRAYTDYDALLSDPEIDGVMVTCATTEHADLIIRAAEAGKNVYVEKALAATAKDARRIRDAVHRAEKEKGIKFVMSDPVQGGAVLVAKSLIEEDAFGQVLLVTSRNGHNNAFRRPDMMRPFQTPAESGGGVMLDMGHHSVHIVHFLLGMPVSASGTFLSVNDYARETGVEDFASLSFQYADGAIGVAQGSFITPGSVNELEVVGTRGVLRFSRSLGLSVELEGRTPYTVSENELPPKWQSPQVYWVECIRNDTPAEHYGVDEACEIVEMIDAAYRSRELAVPVKV